MRTMLLISAVLAALVVGAILWNSHASAQATPAVAAAPASSQPAGKVYELRVYFTHPGKLDALNARFRDHTCGLFKKHGIEIVGFWTPSKDESQPKKALAGVTVAKPEEMDEFKDDNTLVYLLSFPSLEAQKKAWASFRADPEWIKVKTETEKPGPIVKYVISRNLNPTDYSPMK